MNLTEFMSSLPLTDKQAFERRLDVLSQHNLGRQFVSNLNSEVRFTPPIWQDLFNALTNAQADVDNLKVAFVDVFCSYILNGSVIPSPWPGRYGRAVTEDRFCQLLVKQNLATSVRGAKRFLSNLMQQPLPVVQQRLAQKQIGRYLIWATFNQQNFQGDPFEAVPKDAEGVRASLGLDPNDAGDMILLVYRLPVDVEPRYPTVADAYAGGWNWYYRASLAHEPYGLTLCWNLARTDTFNCPEVVHKPVNGNCLLAPIVKVR